jgi:hypothetical protein
MLEIAESVNYGNRCILRHAFNRLLRERAQHNGIHPAFEIVRYVTQLLSRIDSTMSLVDKKGSSAQARHSGLERKAGPKRRLLKEHHELFARQRPLKDRWTRLHDFRQVQHRLNPLRAEVASRNQIMTPEGLRENCRRHWRFVL